MMEMIELQLIIFLMSIRGLANIVHVWIASVLEFQCAQRMSYFCCGKYLR